MKKQLFLIIFALLIGGCATNRDVIESEAVKAKVAQRLNERKDFLPDLSTVKLNDNERLALEFLYAYMPVGDVGDYSVDFFRANVTPTLAARSEMPWGKIVPESEFLHFVLPVRVNNENLDTARTVFFAELKDRVKGLSMKDAILEVNHWCHEKVNYTPSDWRTIAPLSIVRNAAGRCGEESTFAVAALRAVGIPARQIYVGRWAHTDDNHAWVEAWAADENGKNGKWYYFGACEPEPVLNTGWFDAPATRSLMMFTKVFGDYEGAEEVLNHTDAYTEINVTSNYAPTARGIVAVSDSTGNRVSDAQVIFSTYNYAAYYPTVVIKTDSMGLASITAGLGDMVIFASKDGQIATGQLDFRHAQDTLHLTLGALPDKTMSWDLVPPVQGEVKAHVTTEQREANNIRFAAEDSIRGAYIATFISRDASNQIAQEIGADTTRVWDILSASRGNHNEITSFLLNTPRQNVPVALDLLEVISLKDLRDTPSAILFDHLYGSLPYVDQPQFRQYILNPRVDNELLTPYRKVLGNIGGCSTVDGLISLARGVIVRDELNPAQLAITPMGIHKLRIGDRTSTDRYLVTLLRSKGIAARREPLTDRLQYFAHDKWNYIDSVAVAPKGKVKVNYRPSSLNDDPKLNTHFTIARWDGKEYKTVELENLLLSQGIDMGAGASYHILFAQPIELEAGKYMLITGTRLADGTVLNRAEPFTVEAGKNTDVEMVMRSADNSLQVIGSIDAETSYIPAHQNEPTSLLSTTGRGYFVLAMIDAKKEPTTHLLRDLNKQREVLNQWGRPIVLMLRDGSQMGAFNIEDYPELPTTVNFGYDDNGKTASMLGSMLKIKDISRLPIVVVADSFGRVIYVSTGYNISFGEQLATIIEYLN